MENRPGIALVLVAIAAYHLYTLPPPPSFQAPDRPALTIIASEGTTLGFRGASRGHPVPVDELPQHLVDAVLTLEDRRFFEHGGVDPRGLLRAALANVDAGEIVQSWLRDEGAKASATQVALVAMRSDGSVLAMVGGADYASRSAQI